MPKGTVEARVQHIKDLGQEVIVTEVNYDDTVKLAEDVCKEHGYHYVQDTALPGYTQIPLWIMQGYCILAEEAAEEMKNQGKQPTHVFL